jgi:hypothetical protein
MSRFLKFVTVGSLSAKLLYDGTHEPCIAK